MREDGLLLANLGPFVVFLIGMTLTGWSVSNDELTEHGAAAEGLGAYLSSGDFWEAISENWEWVDRHSRGGRH